MGATDLFENSMQWLRQHYRDYRFFTERDVVWTVQRHIASEICRMDAPYRVFNDHTIMPRIRTDLAILSGTSIEVAIEFKYEPSHKRRADHGGDIWPTKLEPSVVFWSGEGSVEKDVQRVKEYVDKKRARVAYSVFIDEGGRFRHRDPHFSSEWVDWEEGVSVLWSTAE